MNYDDQMEMALQEMTSHPEYQRKLIEDEEDPRLLIKIRSGAHQRPTGWWRKRLYRKQLVRRFLGLNPALKIADMPGCDEAKAVYLCDFSDEPFDPRKQYNINMYENLRLSPAGDIRICKKKILHFRYQLYEISSSDIPFAKEFTNRCIRSKVIREDDYIPGGPAYYKKQYSRLICNEVG